MKLETAAEGALVYEYEINYCNVIYCFSKVEIVPCSIFTQFIKNTLSVPEPNHHDTFSLGRPHHIG